MNDKQAEDPDLSFRTCRPMSRSSSHNLMPSSESCFVPQVGLLPRRCRCTALQHFIPPLEFVRRIQTKMQTVGQALMFVEAENSKPLSCNQISNQLAPFDCKLPMNTKDQWIITYKQDKTIPHQSQFDVQKYITKLGCFHSFGF